MSLPSKIARYHVIGRIASGGMAEILLAKVLGPGGFERPVVIKRVLPHLLNEASFRDMFLDEARIVAAIHHPNVVQVHELGREDQELYLVMEYLAGESVRSVRVRATARKAHLGLGLYAHIVAEACAGLHAAHGFTDVDGRELHVVHRDVCPSNLIVTYDGQVKVVDFGIAQAVDRFTLTEAGQVKGKAAYMAPEQCLRHAIDRRTDVFALGVVLFELTTGHRLFSGALESRILASLLREEVPPPSTIVPDYPKELDQICVRATRFDPSERFATAEEMRRELVRFQRTWARDVLPEQDLKLWMHQLFADRIVEKGDLLSRLRAGSGVSHIPPAEVSDEVSVPVVEIDRESPVPGPKGGRDPRNTTYTRPTGATRPDRIDRRVQPSTRLSRAVRTVVLLAMCVGAAFALPSPITDPAVGSPSAEPVRAVQAAMPDERPRAAPFAAIPKWITLELDSRPSGARTLLDGSYRGRTPMSLSLPRQADPVMLRLELAGYQALEQTLVPDVNQRLSVSLSPTPTASPPDASAGDSETSGVVDVSKEKTPPRRRRTVRQTQTPREEFFLFE